MKLPHEKKEKWYYLALAFGLPFFGMLTFMIIGQCTPFGNYSMLYSDMYHQYFPFFKSLREALLSGDNLLYTWNVGMGMDHLGLMAYYLASPLNLLSVLIPENWVLQFFSLLVPIKLGLASLFFAYFLKKLFKKNDLSIALFGSFYGMCAWALGYQWNVMWLDTFALLPLVALGTVYLLRDKKFVLYTISLALSVCANYYIGLFTCIFVMLLFLCYQICRCKSISRFFGDLWRIALFSVLAIGMTAFLELPAFAALQNTQSSVNNFPEGFRLNIADEHTWLGLLDGMRQVAGNINGGITPSFKEGLPNLYCGVGTIILAFLFLTTRHVKLRDKLCSIFLLLFFMVSFLIRQLDYIWHGFHFTNMIPYRFSFLFSFVLLYMAYRAYLLRRRFRLWQILTAGILSIGIMLCSDHLTDPVFIAYNGVFFLLYIGALLYARFDHRLIEYTNWKTVKKISAARCTRRDTASFILLCVMCMELVLNTVNFGVNFPRTYAGGYPQGGEYTASMVRYMKEREKYNLFYRAEVTHSQTLNDGALNSYNGISTFSSSANVNVTKFIQALGYSAKNTYNRYCFEEGSPVSNLFLSLKYMLERNGQLEENPYFDNVHHYGNVYLLENNAYLPLGFLAETQLADLEFKTNAGAFTFQNKLFATATGISEPVWNFTNSKWLTITGTNVNISNQLAHGYCAYSTNTGGILKYTYQINSTGFMCLDATMNARNNFSVWKNGKQLYLESTTLPQVYAVCQVQPGDVIEVHITCKAGENSNMTIRGALLNDDVFRKGYEILNASTLKLTDFSNTYIAGEINCNRDGLMYTSIPQDGNWVVRVDGKTVDSVKVGEAMIGVYLTEGNHTVTFTYRNEAFLVGAGASIACLAIFLWLTLKVYPLSFARRKGKFE